MTDEELEKKKKILERLKSRAVDLTEHSTEVVTSAVGGGVGGVREVIQLGVSTAKRSDRPRVRGIKLKKDEKDKLRNKADLLMRDIRMLEDDISSYDDLISERIADSFETLDEELDWRRRLGELTERVGDEFVTTGEKLELSDFDLRDVLDLSEQIEYNRLLGEYRRLDYELRRLNTLLGRKEHALMVGKISKRKLDRPLSFKEYGMRGFIDGFLSSIRAGLIDVSGFGAVQTKIDRFYEGEFHSDIGFFYGLPDYIKRKHSDAFDNLYNDVDHMAHVLYASVDVSRSDIVKLEEDLLNRCDVNGMVYCAGVYDTLSDLYFASILRDEYIRKNRDVICDIDEELCQYVEKYSGIGYNRVELIFDMMKRISGAIDFIKSRDSEYKKYDFLYIEG